MKKYTGVYTDGTTTHIIEAATLSSICLFFEGKNISLDKSDNLTFSLVGENDTVMALVFIGEVPHTENLTAIISAEYSKRIFLPIEKSNKHMYMLCELRNGIKVLVNQETHNIFSFTPEGAVNLDGKEVRTLEHDIDFDRALVIYNEIIQSQRVIHEQ